MDVSFVPSLERSSCEKIVMLLLDDSDLLWTFAKYEAVKSKVTAKISKLTPCEPVQRKLKEVITPLLMNVKHWIKELDVQWRGMDRCDHVGDAILKCRLPDGTIDKEKCLSILVKNKGINPLHRFVMACNFCLFDDVPDLWNSLNRIEKACVRNESSKDSGTIFRHWIEWLESNRERDWESVAAWTLETSVWKSNVHVLKRVLGTLSPSEKSQYLLKALTEKNVSSDIMWFGLSMMSVDEREVVYRESPLEVFRCIFSWPVRHVFFDFAKKLWPYVTEDTFLSILYMMVELINDDYVLEVLEHIEIMKAFWAQSPDHYKKFVEKDTYKFRKIKHVLEHDFSKPYERPPPFELNSQEMRDFIQRFHLRFVNRT